MKKCKKRDLILGYTDVDDGVHVSCRSCDFDKNIGFYAWIPELNEAVADHFIECEYVVRDEP